MTEVLGVDAARHGWVVVTLRDGKLHSIELTDRLEDTLSDARDATVVGIDMPIGHDDPDANRNGGRRACDEAARTLLGPLSSSVFAVPPLDLFELEDQRAAALEAQRRGSIKPSAQVWALRERLLEVQAIAAEDPRVREVHPEVSFYQLARSIGAEPPTRPKRTWEGSEQRLWLLRDVSLRPRRSMGGVGRAHPHDVLDATAAAWSANELARDPAGRSLPSTPPVDASTGRTVAIWW